MINSLKSFKYFTPFVLYILSLLSFNGNGLICWTPLLYTFFLIPFAELFIKADPRNLDEVEEALVKKNKAYDYILYLAVLMQYYSLWMFFGSLKQAQVGNIDIAGRVISMGLLCGTFGINVAHELGHRVNKMEQTFAKMLLLTSLYMHFFIEHNKGHHKHGADKVVKDLLRAKIGAEAIHGNKSQNARQRALTNFKSGHTRVLVATDIAARGIDVDELSHVINFELPNVPETYVHRIGRTGRAGASGIAFSFCDTEEKEFLRDIQKLISIPVPIVTDHPYAMANTSLHIAPSVKQKPVQRHYQSNERRSFRGGDSRRYSGNQQARRD